VSAPSAANGGVLDAHLEQALCAELQLGDAGAFDNLSVPRECGNPGVDRGPRSRIALSAAYSIGLNSIE
jgi:hypothetical protein